MTPDAPPVDVVVDRLRFGYQATTPILSDVSLAIAPGELFFFLGGSGCGKTTLLRLIAGFLTPHAGTIRFGERDVTTVPTERRDLGMVFQNYALWPHLSVAGNVAFPLEVRGVPSAERRRRVAEALELVELSGYQDRGIGALSGGQQQRVALARAIVARPRVLLLDEPLSNLDARLRGSMRSTIRRVCKAAGVTALYVTHDQGEALSTADRLALLEGGQVVQVGTPREVYDRPATASVARFLGQANVLPPELAARFGGQGTCCLRPERLHFSPQGVPGIVEDGTYEGASARWQVRVGDAVVVVAEAHPPERRAGDQVFMTAAPEALWPVPG